jgi:hypothetical protein
LRIIPSGRSACEYCEFSTFTGLENCASSHGRCAISGRRPFDHKRQHRPSFEL